MAAGNWMLAIIDHAKERELTSLSCYGLAKGLKIIYNPKLPLAQISCISLYCLGLGLIA